MASEHAEVIASPSLSDAMPAAMRKRLERRNTPSKLAAKLDKENSLQDLTEVAPPSGAVVAAGSSPAPKAGTRRRSMTESSPSKCVLEAQRMEEARKMRRMQHEKVRAEGPRDESAEFRQMIADFRESQSATVTKCDGSSSASSDNRRLRVCVRKRPLLPFELDAGEFDVLSCFSRRAVLHQTRRKVDQERVLENHSFVFDELFDERADTKAVYERAARPLVASVFAGGRATCFAYGQTGSGKTHTMMGVGDGSGDGVGVYGLAAHDLFEALHDAREQPDGQDLRISLSMFEIYREQVYDLIGDANAKISVLEDASGEVQCVGLAEVEPTDAEHVLRLLEAAQTSRRTASNSINERSSRSHAVLQFVLRGGPSGAAGNPIKGKFTLVDLAGSERAADTQEADRDARVEGADINRSLLSLKECIRAMDEGLGHVPFRGSKLTHVLRDSFTADASSTAMIAHVAPANRSCDYSINSLRYAERLRATASRGGAAPPPSSPAAPPALARVRSNDVPPPSSPARRPPRAPPIPASPAAGVVPSSSVCESPARLGPPVRVPTTPKQQSSSTAVAVNEPTASREKHEKAVEVLRELLRCAYDVDAWQAEVARLGQMNEGDLIGCVERVDGVLESRAILFGQLRDQLASFKGKLLEGDGGSGAVEAD